MALPTTYDALINKHRKAVPLQFVKALIRGESDFDPKAKSRSSSARGLMQIVSEVRADFNDAKRRKVTAAQLDDPDTNIEIGCWLLNKIVATWQTRYPYLKADWSRAYAGLVVHGYNAGWSKYGTGKAIKWLHDNGKPLTLAAVVEYRDKIGATPFVGEPRRVAWADKVVNWYTAEVAADAGQPAAAQKQATVPPKVATTKKRKKRKKKKRSGAASKAKAAAKKAASQAQAAANKAASKAGKKAGKAAAKAAKDAIPWKPILIGGGAVVALAAAAYAARSRRSRYAA